MSSTNFTWFILEKLVSDDFTSPLNLKPSMIQHHDSLSFEGAIREFNESSWLSLGVVSVIFGILNLWVILMIDKSEFDESDLHITFFFLRWS